MMKYKIKHILLFTIPFFLLQSCADLDVEYKNLPDYEKAMSNPEDVYNISKSGFYNWFMINTSSISPRMAMWVTADNGTCSWANSGMLDLSSEPRRAFNNDVTYTYAQMYENYYEDMYSNLSQANEVLGVLESGMQFGDDGDDTPMIEANSYFVQGLSLGYLALVYDQSYITTQYTDLLAVELSPYQTVMDSAIQALRQCVEVADNNSFSIPMDWFGGESYSNEELSSLAHSFIARFMVQTPRNSMENDNVDWEQVLYHAQNGINKPLQPYIDNVDWINWFYHYTIRSDWAKIDLRVINLMDPSYPSIYPEDGVSPGVARSEDARLDTDFNYVSVINMKPERGYYHYSNYEYSRIELEYKTGVVTGYSVDFSVSENDLLEAEANARLGKLGDAVGILNKGSRIVRGQLDPLPLTSTKDEILNAVFYERDIELIMTGFGIAFFDMRRRDMLQKGTPLHFPIPEKQLIQLGMDTYTFGGEENADGMNTSNGGWF